MSHEGALTTTAASPAVASPRSRTVPSLPATKLLDPLRWYFQWVRSNPESATSLEQMSRTFTLLVSDPTNLINSEACFTLCKMHHLSNNAILSTGSHRTTKTDVLSFVLQAIQEVECLMELVARKYGGHRNAWNALLLLEAIKCTLKTCVHRQLFLIPWLWESLKMSLRRALRHLVSLGGGRRRRVRGGGGKDGSSGTASFALAAGGDATSAVGLPLSAGVGLEYGGVANGSSSGSGLRGAVVGPNNTRLVIPRVASDRRHEHRHVCTAAEAATADGDDHVSFAPDDVDLEDEDAVEEGEAIPFTWVDVLGMVLDMYLLLRPLVLVAVARHSFLRLPAEEATAIAKLPPPLTRAQQAESAKLAAKAAADAKAALAAGQPAPPAPTLPDPLAAIHQAMAAGPQHNLMCSWPAWGAVAGCDVLVALLSRLVRRRRVPVVYINDAENGEAELPAITEEAAQNNGEDDAAEAAAEAEDGGEAETANTTSAAGGRAIGRVQDTPVVSRDRMRVQQALRNVFYGFLRDPFFTAVLKQFVYMHFVKGFVNRIPLVGPCVSFYVMHYLSMQHYSFLYTLGQ